jgi:hypothetical protein
VADAGVVAGGDAVGADLSRSGEQLIELHVIVAERAWNWSAAFEIVIDERADHTVLELTLEIHDVERHAEMLGDASCVVDIVDRTAAMLSWRAVSYLWQASLVPELHREAHHRLAARMQECSNGGAINTAAHGNGDGGGSKRGHCGRLRRDIASGEWMRRCHVG